MAYKGRVPIGEALHVVFSADLPNEGHSAITLLWAKGTQLALAEPGETVELPEGDATIPASRQLSIDIDVPDGRGSGTLTVQAGGVTIAEGRILGDERWRFSVR